MTELKTIFAESLGIEESLVTNELTYNKIPQWDSVAHMVLINNLETKYDILFETDDIIDMSNFEKAKRILKKYDVNV